MINPANVLYVDIMKIPKLLPRKLLSSDNNEDEDDADNEKPDNTESQDQTETQSENQQETVQKRADNQAILRLLGEGEKVGQSWVLYLSQGKAKLKKMMWGQ